MNTFKSMMLTSFSSSSSSSSSDDKSNDEYMVTLLGAYEKNNASMLQILKSSDSSKKIGGSVVGHKYIRKDRKQGHERLFADYFATNPVYSLTIFRRCFRMRRPWYLRILNAIQTHNSYFVQKQDAAHVVGLSPLQKMTSTMRILSYGVTADVIDDYIRIGESTAIQSLQQICNSVIEIFGPEHLRSPTPTDIARLFAIGEVRGFPGKVSPVHYTINGHSYDMGYYLADGGDVRFWDSKMFANIMKSCIILHNMIVEDERNEHLDFDSGSSSINAPVQLSSIPTNDFQSFLSRHLGIRDKDAYHAPRNDLIEHMWHLHGEN
ncbi:uncharacterized protein LOC114294129 [Camellia sinensis]|uniref:uncharacterized protein LOC114294129 n=1 Tax=Camellia sinensis TaxID=4442 RepID=UPI00103561DF|nr:uncharacterized protein LOC114294129 [Camellia sinensis]